MLRVKGVVPLFSGMPRGVVFSETIETLDFRSAHVPAVPLLSA
jgi:hypothetical protein